MRYFLLVLFFSPIFGQGEKSFEIKIIDKYLGINGQVFTPKKVIQFRYRQSVWKGIYFDFFGSLPDEAKRFNEDSGTEFDLCFGKEGNLFWDIKYDAGIGSYFLISEAESNFVSGYAKFKRKFVLTKKQSVTPLLKGIYFTPTKSEASGEGYIATIGLVHVMTARATTLDDVNLISTFLFKQDGGTFNLPARKFTELRFRAELLRNWLGKITSFIEVFTVSLMTRDDWNDRTFDPRKEDGGLMFGFRF